MTNPPAVRFRLADRGDVPAVMALLRDDQLGQGREATDPTPYFAAFDAMQAEGWVQAECMKHPDYRESYEAFVAKRPKDFVQHWPGHGPARKGAGA